MSPFTFEELASREVDTLYQGALFMNGGDEDAAEGLLLWTLTHAFHAFRRGSVGDPGRWLEARLVREFLQAAGDDAAEPVHEDVELGPVDAVAELAMASLARAAAVLPYRARAALWLVVFRRWSYADAARELGLDIEGLKDVLRYRDLLVRTVIRGATRNGTDA